MATPIKVTLEANKEYYYCTCGKSEDGLFCNGSHQDTSFTPSQFSVEKSKDYYMCPCKQNDGAPFCNGAHAK